MVCVWFVEDCVSGFVRDSRGLSASLATSPGSPQVASGRVKLGTVPPWALCNPTADVPRTAVKGDLDEFRNYVTESALIVGSWYLTFWLVKYSCTDAST